MELTVAHVRGRRILIVVRKRWKNNCCSQSEIIITIIISNYNITIPGHILSLFFFRDDKRVYKYIYICALMYSYTLVFVCSTSEHLIARWQVQAWEGCKMLELFARTSWFVAVLYQQAATRTRQKERRRRKGWLGLLLSWRTNDRRALDHASIVGVAVSSSWSTNTTTRMIKHDCSSWASASRQTRKLSIRTSFCCPHKLKLLDCNNKRALATCACVTSVAWGSSFKYKISGEEASPKTKPVNQY